MGPLAGLAQAGAGLGAAQLLLRDRQARTRSIIARRLQDGQESIGDSGPTANASQARAAA